MDIPILSKRNGEIKSERQHLIIGASEQGSETFVYKRRWFVLAVFSFACMTQALVWNTWGPISESLELVFGWSDGLVALLPNLGNISYFLLVIPGGMVLDSKGLRISMIVCVSFLLLCTALRCFTLKSNFFTPLVYISSLNHGLSGVMTFAAPPLAAAVWFPAEERPIATAIGSFFNSFGVSISFVIGPKLVPGPIYETISEANKSIKDANNENDIAGTVVNLQEMKSGISNLMYTHAGIAAILFVLVLTYFPDKPPRPPSTTASIKRTDYKDVIRMVVRNGPLWIVMVAGALPIGVCGAWIVVIDVIIKAIGISQEDAGWMGFYHSLIGSLSGILIAKYSIIFHGRRKLFLTTMFSCAAICVIWFALLCDSSIAFNLPSLYASCVLIGIFINGTTPLFYEMAVEASYPVGEGVTGAFYTWVYVLFGSVFLFLVGVPNIGITWLNWIVLGALCVSIPLLLVFPERYKRSDIDLKGLSV